jgi:CRISPR/Cas system CSM-associated protein Csm2 small subunit
MKYHGNRGGGNNHKSGNRNQAKKESGFKLEHEKEVVPNPFKSGEHLATLFGEKAEEFAITITQNDKKYIGGKKEQNIKSTQFQKFYQKVYELLEDSESGEEFKTVILPQIILLKSKVERAYSRDLAGIQFKNMMQSSIDLVKSHEELKNFKLFLESIIGYMPK